MIEITLRTAALCLALAGTEMLHGIARVKYVVPRIGRERAQRWSIVSGSLLAFCICFAVVPTTGVRSREGLLALGAVLAAFMAAFDAAVGRYVAKRPWKAVRDDFNPTKGNLLAVGLVVLTFSPVVVAWLRGAR